MHDKTPHPLTRDELTYLELDARHYPDKLPSRAELILKAVFELRKQTRFSEKDASKYA